MVKIGPKELAMRELRESKTTTKDKKVTAKIIKNMLDPNKIAGGDVALPASKPKAEAIDAAAKSKDDDGVPSFLRRPPPTPEQEEKLRKKHAPVDLSSGLKVTEPYNPNDPIRKAIAKDLNAVEKPPTGLDRLRASPNAEAIRLQTLADQTKARNEVIMPKPEATANQKESVMRTTAKTKSKEMTKAKPSKSPVSKKAASNNARKPVKPSKSDLVEQMLTSKKGATRDELKKVTGWPGGANLGVAASRAKKKLVEKDGRFFLV